MINLVNDLDQISSLEYRTINLDLMEHNIYQVVEDLLSEMNYKENSKKINIKLKRADESKRYIAVFDRSRIEQVVVNLVDNAIKYGNENGLVEIIISEKEKKILVSVKDNGIGINPSDLPRLFERFYRVEKSRVRTAGGSGLGLAIVKHIVEAHNQRITVRSEDGVGTEFVFSLAKSN
jgi:two-component system phosphate regulon sensor histidine kinase PhoR